MVSQKFLTQKTSLLKVWKERKSDKSREKKEWEGLFTFPWYNTSLSTSIPKMTTLACTVLQNLWRKIHSSKYGKKENWTNAEKNKQQKAGSQSHNTIHHYHPAYQIWLLQLPRFHRNLWRKISLFKVWKEIWKTQKYPTPWTQYTPWIGQRTALPELQNHQPH